MKVIIDIPESIIEHIKDGSFGARPYDRYTLVVAVLNGTSLPKGRWIASPLPDDWVGTLYTCSNCGAVEDSRSSYCPRCGAKMDAESEEEK